ncbi:hypothetical protein [Rhodanobacter ginsengiterrae]|uniref:hypothetical protein n=1 Tax=Rhodanobacter ginsengiterrae TaxID=2008451 RepID=UPI003CEFB2C5
MKFESMILASLFVACFALCTLVLGAMLTATPNAVPLAGTTTSAATAHCAQAVDAASCPRA